MLHRSEKSSSWVPYLELPRQSGRTLRVSGSSGALRASSALTLLEPEGHRSLCRPPRACRAAMLDSCPRETLLDRETCCSWSISAERPEADLLLSLRVPQILANLEQGLAEDGATRSIAQENRQGQCCPRPRRAGPACSGSQPPSASLTLSRARLLAAFLLERASFLGGSYLRVAPWSRQQEEGPPGAWPAPASPPSHPTSPPPPALRARRGSWFSNRCFHVSGWDTQASGRQAAVTRAAVLTPTCNCPQPHSGEPLLPTALRGGPATRRARLLVQSGSVPLKLGGRREHSPRSVPGRTGSRGQGRATDVGAPSVGGWAAGRVPGRSPLLSCSLRAAVAVPPGPGDVLHGQLPAAHEGTISQRWGAPGPRRGRAPMRPASRGASGTPGVHVLQFLLSPADSGLNGAPEVLALCAPRVPNPVLAKGVPLL